MKNSIMTSKNTKPFKACFAVALLFATLNVNAQVLISDTDTEPDTKSIVDVNSTSKGFLWPRLTTSAIDAISNPTEGLVVYDSDKQLFLGWNGTKWANLGLDSQPAATNPNITQFEAGDFAFTAIQSDTPDTFSMIPFKPVPAGQVFYITDCGVYADRTSFRLTEGAIKWEVTETIPARTEVTFGRETNGNVNETLLPWFATIDNVPTGIVTNVEDPNNNYSATFNDFGPRLTNRGDQIIFFTSSDEEAPLNNIENFVTALSLESDWLSSGETDASDESYLPNGLIQGENAATLPSSGDNKKLICTPNLSTMNDEQLRLYISNEQNWQSSNSQLGAPSECDF